MSIENAQSNFKHSSAFAWGIVLLALSMTMSFFAYAKLSDNPRVFEVAVAFVVVLDFFLLYFERKTRSLFDIGFELTYLLTLIVLAWGVFSFIHTISLRGTPLILVATIFYRPKLLEGGNRKLAFSISVALLTIVTPVAFGMTGNSDAIGFVSALYALGVTLLWICCSGFVFKAIKVETDKK